MPTNNFLPFTPTSSGTNLLTNAEYLATAGRTSGNQPGVASSKLNNKAIRQSSFITSQFAQFLSNTLNQDVVDVDGGEAAILAQITAALTPLAPTVQRFLSGSGTYELSYRFFIAAGNATAGATYTNNAVTFTVKETVAAGTLLWATGIGDPSVSGTLTKTSGTGDATLTFSAFRKPISLEVTMVGGGGGGAGSGTASAGAGGNGGNTTFGTSLLSAGGGFGAAAPIGGNISSGVGGTASLGVGPIGIALPGAAGGGSSVTGVSTSAPGGIGGSSPFGGAGRGRNTFPGGDAETNSGSGGGGGGAQATASMQGGGGGGAGGYAFATITNLLLSYTYIVGGGGAAGTSGTSGFSGGAGGSGLILIKESYQ